MVDGSPSAGWREVAEKMDIVAGLPECVGGERSDLEGAGEKPSATDVRRRSGRPHQFKLQAGDIQAKEGATNQIEPGEGSGEGPEAWTPLPSPLRIISLPPQLAVGLFGAAIVGGGSIDELGMRKEMVNSTTCGGSADLISERLGPIGLWIGRFGFSSPIRPNAESPDVGGGLVDLVELVGLFRGSTCVGTLAHSQARTSPSLPPDETDQIDQSDQTLTLYGGYDLVDRQIGDQIGDQTEVMR